MRIANLAVLALALAALGCYQSMGFVIHDYPEGAPMADLCYYLTRPV